MRYIFMDEAGRSEVEPITVIAGIIAHADEHVLSAEGAAFEALGCVPAQFKQGFVFSAKDVVGYKKYKEDWSLTDRLDLLYTMMSIPRRIGMAIVFGAQWRGATDFSESYGKRGLNPAESDHVHAFHMAIAVADRNIRKHAGLREVATVVAENIPEMHRFLKNAPRTIRENPKNLSQSYLRETVSDAELGYIQQSGDLRVTRIRNPVHFVDKADDPLVQVADACAYGFCRFLKGEKFGLDYARAIAGDEILLRNFASPGGAECIWPELATGSG